MSKKLFISVVMLTGALLAPAGVSAHELVKDQVGDAGALLYIDPDDDPVVGEPSTIYFEVSDSSVTPESSKVSLVIIDNRSTSVAVPTKITDSSISGTYAFPRQGLYEIRLTIKQGDEVAHVFSESKQVSRSVTGGAAASSAPVWAKVGIAATVLAAIAMATLAFKRRKGISEYSKMVK